MDKGLEFQVELTKKGEKIFLEVLDIIHNLNENDKMYYLMSRGISLCVTEKYILIWLIIGTEDNECQGVGMFTNPFQDRIIAKEAICNYLINNQEYYFEMENDIYEKTGHELRRDDFTNIHFWFNN